MYTRTYNDEKSNIIIPESYGGTALYESAEDKFDNVSDPPKNPWESDAAAAASAPVNEGKSEPTSFLSKIKIPAFLSNIFNSDNFGLQKIGTEEILLIAVAAFLFFSKDGDKECSLLLLALLFLK